MRGVVGPSLLRLRGSMQLLVKPCVCDTYKDTVILQSRFTRQVMVDKAAIAKQVAALGMCQNL